jgi:hypothetical protein
MTEDPETPLRERKFVGLDLCYFRAATIIFIPTTQEQDEQTDRHEKPIIPRILPISLS